VRFNRAAGFFLALVCCGAASAQSTSGVIIGRDCSAFHPEKFGVPAKLEAPVVSDVEIFVELIGLPNAAKINTLHLQIRRVLGFNDAAALEGEGCPTIVFDPNFAAGDTAGFYLVLAHEAGHHFCGHTTGDVQGDHAQRELEADQFGGSSIKRFEVYHNRPFFADVFATAATRYPEGGSALYPARTSRLEALKRGYFEGSSCGGLAPVEQGGFEAPRAVAPSVGSPKPCHPVRTGPTSYACEH
jgi:hypothetical protein